LCGGRVEEAPHPDEQGEHENHVLHVWLTFRVSGAPKRYRKRSDNQADVSRRVASMSRLAAEVFGHYARSEYALRRLNSVQTEFIAD
jgi:hypothetical protein